MPRAKSKSRSKSKASKASRKSTKASNKSKTRKGKAAAKKKSPSKSKSVPKKSVKSRGKSSVSKGKKSTKKGGRKRNFFKVSEDWEILSFIKKHKKMSVSAISQEIGERMNRSAESIRDRIKRYLSKIRAPSQKKIQIAARVT